MSEAEGFKYCPIPPHFLDILDPEYVKFYNENWAWQAPMDKFVQMIRNPETDMSQRNGGTSPVVQVGSVTDIRLQNCKIRVYTPETNAPADGWPVFLFIPGGGWTLDGLKGGGASFAARQCKENNCLAVCVSHRLAPEHPYPAAVEDVVDVLKWIHQHGKAEIGANPNKIAIGGSSSGGNLAAVLSMKATELNPPIPILFQLLLVPAVDNTSSETSGVYKSLSGPGDFTLLSVENYMWFRRQYLPDPTTWANWDCSPLLAPESLLKNAPPTWIAVCELDILRDEGIAYGKKLEDLGVKVVVKCYDKATHEALVLDGVLEVGRTIITDAVNALKEALWGA